MTQHQIPEDWNPWLHHCDNPKLVTDMYIGQCTTCQTLIQQGTHIPECRFSWRFYGLWHHLLWQVIISILEDQNKNVHIFIIFCNIFLAKSLTNYEPHTKNIPYGCHFDIFHLHKTSLIQTFIPSRQQSS